MIRIELLETRGNDLYTVGLYQLVEDTFFELKDLDTRPRFANARRLYWAEVGKQPLITHLGIFPDVEYTGMVIALIKPMVIKTKKDTIEFKPGAIDIALDRPPFTVIKGAK